MDLDNVLGDDGTPEAYAARIINTLNSWTEVSVSGSGVHILVKGRLPRHFTRHHLGGPVEVYPKDGGRFLLITGDTRPDLGSLDGLIEERHAELAELFLERPVSTIGTTGSDQVLPGGDLTADECSAVVAALEPAWMVGQRHQLGMAAAGLLAKTGVSEVQALEIVARLSSEDEQPWDREKTVRDTYDRHRGGLEFSGYSALRELMEPRKLSELSAALDTFTQRRNSDAITREQAGSDKPEGVDWAAGPQWPILDPAALYGLAGDIVRVIAPHTEGDPVALLVNILTMFGSAVGPAPHARVGATQHRPNLFAVQVGETSRARKGTVHHEVLLLMKLADPVWAARVLGGLSSGEGLIHAVRDPEWKVDKDGEPVLADPGVEDKRLLVAEPEFSSVLRVAGREGNILSELLRRAWDGDDLRTLTRNSPLSATSPHISILGHITKHELLRELTETYQANGFANRFQFYCVKRSQFLPHGGALPDAEVAALAHRVESALQTARARGVLRRDPETNRVWEAVYPALTAERPGMVGAITARAEAQVLRLSLLYALLDEADVIRRPHLEAALAIWQYAEDSARFIFGDATGDPIADRILQALRTNGGMTETQISELFGRNQKAGRLHQALALLLSARKVRTWQGESSGGRAPTYWEAVP